MAEVAVPGPFHQHRPVFRNRQVLVERRRGFGRRNAHRDFQFAGGFAAKDASGGRHIGVIAADRGANVAVAGEQAIGGIEADPAKVRQQRFDPGVSGAFEERS